MLVGQNIHKIRKEKRLTQKQLSELTGIAEATIIRYEKNKFTPKVSQIERIAKALEVLAVELMDENFKNSLPYVKRERLSDYSTKELLEEIERRCRS